MINKLIKETLDSIGVESFYLKTTTKTDNYCVFSIYSEKESHKCDDDNLCDTYFVSINYWFSNPKGYRNYKNIVNAFKEKGFILDSISDISDGDYVGKNIDFVYTSFKEEL